MDAEERDQVYTLSVDGLSVNRICLDYQFRLEFLADRPARTPVIVIEGPFSIQATDTIAMFNAEQPQSLGGALKLLRRTVVTARAFGDGSLTVQFDDGAVLSVAPDPHYEAWQSHGPHGEMMVSLPGGGLAVWDPRSDMD